MDNEATLRAELCLRVLGSLRYRSIVDAAALGSIIDEQLRNVWREVRTIPTADLVSLVGNYLGTDFRHHLVQQLATMPSHGRGLVESGIERLLLRSRATIPPSLLSEVYRANIAANDNHPFPGFKSGDSHVHAGGISSPEDVLRSVLPQLHLMSGPSTTLRIVDSCGSRFWAEPLIYLLGFAALCCANSSLMTNQNFVLAAEANGIEDVAAFCWSMSMNEADAELLPMTTLLAHAVDLVGESPSLGRVLTAVRSWLKGARPSFGMEVPDMLSALVLVQQGICVLPSSCLNEFDSRFRFLGQLRRLVPSEAVSRLTNSLASLTRSGQVARLELRKNIVVPRTSAERDTSSIAAELRSDLIQQISAVEDLRMAYPGRELQATMPVSFARVSHSSASVERGTLRYSLADFLTAAEGLVSLLNSEPWTAALIGGVDAVGVEGSTPNFVLSQCYAWIAGRLPLDVELTFSVHAGEQYSNPLNGLRRIGELLDFAVPVSRIGHGLALGLAEFELSTSPTPLEALLDVVWLADLLDGDAEAIGLAVDIGNWTFQTDRLIGWNTWNVWRHRLFSLAQFQEIGLVPVAAAPSVNEAIPPEVDSQRLEATSDADRLACATLLEGGYAGWDVQDVLPAEYRARYGRLGARCFAAAKEKLISLLGSVTIECCPTSNVLLGNVSNYASHPIWEFIRRGIQVSISTDDPGLFGTSLADEYARLLESRGAHDPSTLGLLDEVAVHSLTSTLTSSPAEYARAVMLAGISERRVG